jgi:AraC-like DNA-binding protein
MTYFEEQLIQIRNSTYGSNCKDYLFGHVMQAKNFIETHFAEEINIDQIAGKACFSKYHFIRLFKSIYYQTPHQYLMEIRIDKAMQLLGAGKTIKEACYLVGFTSLGSFKVLFKRQTKQTPLAYKKLSARRQTVSQNSAPCLLQYFVRQKSNFQDPK